MFLEERLNLPFRFGSGFDEKYTTEEVKTGSGNEYRRLLHPYPTLMVNLDFTNKTETALIDQLVDLYHRSGGKFGGFRLKNAVDYSTNSYTETPTSNDQACTLISDGIYQAVRWYGDETVNSSTRRRIRKPVAASMLVGIRDDFSNPVTLSQLYSVDYTTGQITFDVNVAVSIISISQAAQAVVTVLTGHGILAGDSVHFSGVVGMTEINGLRAIVQAVTTTTITVDIDSSLFTAYTSDGGLNTRPQTNETVTCGCEFDIPMRFETDLSGVSYIARNSSDLIMGANVRLIEILNP